jgi:ribosomal 50S subunit-associated protein YjgA (DUF615 family)
VDSAPEPSGIRASVDAFHRIEALVKLAKTMNGVILDLTTGVADVAARVPEAERVELRDLIRAAQAAMTAADDQLGAALRDLPEGARIEEEEGQHG